MSEPCNSCNHGHDYTDEPCVSCGCDEVYNKSQLTDIVIVEAAKVKPGDVLILSVNESLSAEHIYTIRGRLEQEFEGLGIKFFIVCGASLTHLTKEDLL